MTDLRVLIAYPPDPSPALLARLRSAAPGAEIVACHYEEDGARRSARGRGDTEALAVMPAPPLTAAQRDALAGADVMLAFDVPTDILERAPRLRWIQAIGAGVDHLRDAQLGERVVVTNAAGIAAVPIAEFVIGRLLEVWKRAATLSDLQRRHSWKPTYGRVFAGSTLGLVGLGAIGTAVGERARALGVHVLGIRRRYEPGQTSPGADELFGPDRLFEVLGRSDAVVVSAPSTPETQDLFDAPAFAAMRRGAVFCNVARGALVDEDGLIDALVSGHVRAAILDVTKQEPLPADSPLWDAPNLYLSAHCAASPERYFELLFDLFAKNLARFCSGEPLHNAVDVRAGY